MKKTQFPLFLLALGYTLGIWKGHIALWEGKTTEPAHIFPQSASSLPWEDQLALESGIEVKTRTQLLQLLEDYLS